MYLLCRHFMLYKSNSRIHQICNIYNVMMSLALSINIIFTNIDSTFVLQQIMLINKWNSLEVTDVFFFLVNT